MNKIIEFLFPEYQIIKSIKTKGFMVKNFDKANKVYNRRNQNSSYEHENKKYATRGNNSYLKKSKSQNSIPYTRKTNIRVNKNSIESDFDDVKQDVSKKFVGQKQAIDDLMIAFKRPLVVGYDKSKPKNTIFIIGKQGVGKYTLLNESVTCLEDKKLINYSSFLKMDLSLYPTQSEKNLFLSDLYKVLYNSSDIVVFENFDKCHQSILDVLSSMVVDGKYKFNSRYAMENDNLVEANGVLMKNSISEISSNGKYFVFLTSMSEKKIADIFNAKFMNCICDIIKFNDYSDHELFMITGRFLYDLSVKCEKNLSLEIKWSKELIDYCLLHYKKNIGLSSIEDYIVDYLYKGLSEYKLRNNVNDSIIELDYRDDKIVAILNDKLREDYIDLSNYLPEIDKSNLEEIKEELNKVVGLDNVKQYVLDLENNFKVQQMRENAGFKATSISKHMIFTGNPGTGKTTIARIVAKYLKSIGVLSTGQLKEVSRADLVGQYVGHTAKQTNEVIQSALGGVLFIDEAYSLCRDKNDSFGLEAIDALVKAIEDYRDDLVVILAGYKNEMNDFLKTNSGLKSRFPNIIDFPDYTSEEMADIADVIAKSKGYEISEDCKKPLNLLFEKSQIKGRNDSGNGRLVRNIIESSILSQSKRIAKNNDADLGLLTYEDFNFENYEDFDLEKSLEEIIGLDNVKNFVRKEYQLLLANEKRKEAGIEVDTTQSLNMIFSGNPGTGKTTIARVVAKMFKDMGFLKQGHLVETDRGGLVAEYVGQTAKKTEEVFKSALGGVLFIDEAYALSSDGNSFGKEAIDTLVKLIEDYRGEIVVILAGYKKEMNDFLKTNSGLESRFPLKIDFPDYNEDELFGISLKIIDSKGFKLQEDAENALKEQICLAYKTSSASSGNGRMVRNIIEKILLNQSTRIALSNVEVDELNTIISSDIIKQKQNQNEYDLETEMNKIIGLDEVKDYIRSLYARLRLQNERKKLGLMVDNSQSLHMIFKGNPGTGKTMIARTVANFLYNIGIINSNKLVETDRAGLVAGYVGQTAIKTTEKVQEALDGVLFIDEAYSLSQGGANDFGKEAIDTLVKLMDDNRERLVVILAGYSDDMDNFLNVNSGLKSRFPNIIEFSDYNPDELMQIANLFYKSKGYALSEDAKKKLLTIFETAVNENNFGNGRYVRNVFEKSVNNQALRLSTDMDLTREELLTIEDTDIERM